MEQKVFYAVALIYQLLTVGRLIWSTMLPGVLDGDWKVTYLDKTRQLMNKRMAATISGNRAHVLERGLTLVTPTPPHT